MRALTPFVIPRRLIRVPNHTKLILLIAVGVLTFGSAMPVLAGSVSSGGPWSWSRGGITAQMTGSHASESGKAYAQTEDYNGMCGALAARLKYNPGGVDTGWGYSSAFAGTFRVYGPSGSTAFSSQHQAQHNWDGSWSSGIRQPHSF